MISCNEHRRVLWRKLKVIICTALLQLSCCKNSLLEVQRNGGTSYSGYSSNFGASKMNGITKKDIDFSEIAFIEPSYGISEQELHALQKYFPLTNMYSGGSKPYLASSDENRFRNVENAIFGDKKYIWAVRGGYGSARLFERLSSLKKPENNKVLIGYSDVTFLHLFFGSRYGWKCIYAAMPIDSLREKNPENLSLLAEILQNPKGEIRYNIEPLNSLASKMETNAIEGHVIGGNLTLLTNSLGTKWQFNAKNKILFMEDVSSKGYAIDRDLTHLKQAGIFANVRAVLFGSFVEGDNNSFYAIKNFAEEIDIPVFYSENFGHGYNNYPLIFGFNTKIMRNSTDGNFEIITKYDFTK